MKLKLEHLAPYLPYKLRMSVESKYCTGGGFWTLKGNETELESRHLEIQSNHCKPILHPLSEYCGKMIAGEGMKLLNCDLESINEIWDLQGTEDLDAVSVKTYNVMCRNHLDFNFLINAGLAIDINTL